MIKMTIINLEENLVGFNRYNGGWVKTITGLDKDYQNGYSLNGEFVANKRVKNVDLKENILYLDCSIGGSRKNQEKNYHLFKFEDGEIEVIQTIENGQSDWALQLWDNVEKELGLQKSKIEMILDDIDSLDAKESIEFMEQFKTKIVFKIFITTKLGQLDLPNEKLNELLRTM